MLAMIIEFKSRNFAVLFAPFPSPPKKRLVDILPYPHQSGGKLDVVVRFVDSNNVTLLIVFCKYLFFISKRRCTKKIYSSQRGDTLFNQFSPNH